MKKIIIFLLSFSLLQVNAQVEKIINVPYTSSAAPTFQALLNQPSDYTTATTKKYPLLVFCQGAGEAADGTSTGTGVQKIYNSLGSGGPAYFIEHGQWPASFTNPVTGAQEQFIIVSVQANSWSCNGDQLQNIVSYLVATYRADVNRIHITGPSAGGEGSVQYASQMDPNDDNPVLAIDKRTWPAADIVPMSQASDNPTSAWANVAVADSTPVWGFGDPKNDIHGGQTQDYVTFINQAKTGYGRFTTFNTGHGPWNPFYIPTYTESFTWKGKTANWSIYTWMLANVRSGATTPPVTTPPVTTPPVTGPVKNVRIILTPNQDGGWINSAPAYNPGDTLDLSNINWTYFELNNGKWPASNKLVITNSNGLATLNDGITIRSEGVKITGSGTPGLQYGILLTNPTPTLRTQGPFAFSILGHSKNIELERFDIHNTGMGVHIEQDNDCDQSLDYPNWILDSVIIHDGRIVGTWDEGIYFGNTSPDNGNYDPRVDQCAVTQATPTYSLPMKNGYGHVYNMIIDSTGRGGIQGVGSFVEIDHNNVSHNGLNGDDAQGIGISIGLYTLAYIHDNTVVNTLTFGIGSIGGGFTNKRIRIVNNHIDSSGLLFCYPRLATTSDESFDPAKEVAVMDPFTYPYAIWMATRPRIYTQASGGLAQAPPGAPFGTAVKGQDSTVFTISGNTIGRWRSFTSAVDNPSAIQIEDDNPGMQVNGDSICNNVSSLGQPINIYTGRVLHPINIVQCGVVAPSPPAPVSPTVSAGPNQTVTLPIPGVNLVGSVTAGDTAKVTQTWALVSGPSNPTIANAGQTAAIVTGIAAGTYVFKLTATSKNGLSASATVTVVVNPAPVVTPPAKTIKSITITYTDGTSETKP